jgi:signal transduction histidine kinase
MKEKRKRILICDDDRGFLTVLAESFRARGYEPVIVETGKKCLELFSQHRADLVLLDYRLSDMEGTEVLEELRTVDEGCPVIFMTGFGDQKLAAKVIKSGAMDYLVKPFDMAELAKSIEKTLRKAREIKKQKEKEKLLLWGRLFPLLAHEIRTPLHNIGGALTLIRSRCQHDGTTIRAIQIMEEEILRLNQFVGQCLNFSRPSSKLGLNSIDLNEAARSCLLVMEAFFGSLGKELQVESKLDPSIAQPQANLDQIKQVICNLLRNAVEAIPKEGRIVIETSQRDEASGGYVQLKVIDNGVGIKRGDLPSIFTPFFSRKRTGIGLGLALCKKIVEENHQGKIYIDSQLSKGTTITMTLPFSTSKASEFRI